MGLKVDWMALIFEVTGTIFVGSVMVLVSPGAAEARTTAVPVDEICEAPLKVMSTCSGFEEALTAFR